MGRSRGPRVIVQGGSDFMRTTLILALIVLAAGVVTPASATRNLGIQGGYGDDYDWFLGARAENSLMTSLGLICMTRTLCFRSSARQHSVSPVSANLLAA